MTDLLRRFASLPLHEQFTVYERLTDALGTLPVPVSAERRRTLWMADALRAIRATYDALIVPYEHRMTAAEFNAANRRLGLDWRSSRIHRAWGSWKRAMNVWQGGRAFSDAGRDAVRVVFRARKTNCRLADDSLMMWLASNPPGRSMHVYDAWAKAENEKLSSHELRHLSSSGVANALAMPFPAAVTAAKAGALRDPTYEEQVITLDGRRFVNAFGVAQLIGEDAATISRRANVGELPPRVARAGKVNLWLEDDIRARLADHAVVRRRDELADLFLNQDDLADIFGMTQPAISRRLSHGRPMPRPIRLNRAIIWSRAEVEAWLEQHPEYDRRA